MKKFFLIGVVIVGAAAILIGGWAAWDYHEQPAFCGATCHIMQPYLASWISSPQLANAHAGQNVVCLDCHEPTIQQQMSELAVYVKGDYSVPLEERAFTSEFCFKCHEHESYEQIAELTADISVDGVQINPHANIILDPDAHEPETYIAGAEYADPHSAEHGELECNVCHKVHQESPGLATCYDCHHDAIFVATCEACHLDDEIVFSEQAFPEEACVQCHDYESADQLIGFTRFYTEKGDAVDPHAYPMDPDALAPEAYLDPALYDNETPNPHTTGNGEVDCYGCHTNMEQPVLDSCASCHHDEIYYKACVECHKDEDFRDRVEMKTE